jgi:hypothetical protein
MAVSATAVVPCHALRRPRRPMQFLAPRTSRALFELFSTYSTERGLDDLLARLDVAGMGPHHIYHAILGRRPETLQAARTRASYNARDHMRGALRSKEFQSRIIRLILDAYPEKERVLFAHVPKCAGTDLRKALSTLFPSLDLNLADPDWTPQERMFEAISQFAIESRFSKTILLHGHIRVGDAVDGGLARPTDRIVTIIRDPREIVISNLNYVLMRIRDDQNNGRVAPDSAVWRRVLQLDMLPPDLPDHVLTPLVKAMLRNPNITKRNSICHWLGNGDARTVVRRLVTSDVEVTDTANYPDWLRQRWGINRSARANASCTIVTPDRLDTEDRVYIEEITAEDRQAFTLLSEQIARSPTHSVFGHELTGIDQFS